MDETSGWFYVVMVTCGIGQTIIHYISCFNKKNWILCYFIYLCFDSYELHENFQKYIGGVACCEYETRCILALWFLLSSPFFSSPNLSRRGLDVPYFHTWCGLTANLRCRSEMCCVKTQENTGRKKSPKNRHLGTITQLCRAISSQLRHLTTIGNKLVEQQYLLHMSLQYGELRPTN